MSNLILLLTSVVSLLQGVNSPDVSISAKLQALDISYQAINMAQKINKPVPGNETLGAIEISLEQRLKTLQANQKANIKGIEIAKIKSNPRTNIKFSGADYDIEIVDIKVIEGGVEVYARAWDKNGQIGFGDGSVDIERFIFINPPVLVDDPTGTIVRQWTELGTGIVKHRYLKEDLRGAILQSLAHTIYVKKEKFGSDKIIKGKIGHTTLTVYPDANPETTTVDGEVYQHYGNAASQNWATMIAAAGNFSTDFGADHDSGNPDFGFYFQADDATNLEWWGLLRSIFLFNTSSLGANSSISSAVLSLFGTSKADALSILPTIDIYTSNPASNTALADGDYNRTLWSSTSQTGSPITYTNYSTTAYNDFTFNATGRGNISKTSISKFGARNANYDVAEVVPAWTAGQATNMAHNSADVAGTANDPKLVIEYSALISTITPQVIIIN